ncbi:prephenate dehydrogenase (NADP(+)) [Marasmius tenuissimus]|uniref:Prephenate dehydrogenase (NADP(+)) n=1 Tax=Marasmius tenuissimus TaxID=585030 RepID=A0ABR3A124_9AGAR|nr:prephenate dehydrogenase (NADP(+)) [Marasmius tenuissimus]
MVAMTWKVVNPNDPIESQPTLGLIGMGAMGKMYANLLSKAGWKKIHVCDRPAKFQELKEEYANVPGVKVFQDGHGVARSSDFMMYSVEAEFIEQVVAEYGPSTKVNAIVAGQTSVKAPEREAFEKHLPADAQIISCHSLHGPTVSPLGQPLILIQHRGTDHALHIVEDVLRSFGSRYVYLSYEEHDRITANTQAVTHAAFMSMGSAWASEKTYPWEKGLYVGGIETVKVNLTLRIFSNAWHVYAGLAILNPKAREQINQYAKSATELYKLMVVAGTGAPSTPPSPDPNSYTNGGGNGRVRTPDYDAEREKKLRERIYWARQVVFGDSDGNGGTKRKRRPILLSQELLDQFTLGQVPPQKNGSSQTPRYRPNSHLSLLAMVDCWAHLGIQPFEDLSVAATPLFRLFLGVAEYLFLSQELLDSSINSAIYETWHKSNDLEFVLAARGWSQCVNFGSFEVYRMRFAETRAFFETRFDEAGVLGSKMIKAVMESEMEREESESV